MVLRLSTFQVIRRSASTPWRAQLRSNRSSTCGLGHSKTSIPSACSPDCSAWAKAMKKRPSKVPISAIGPRTPNSLWMRIRPQVMAAANREDMPTTLS